MAVPKTEKGERKLLAERYKGQALPVEMWNEDVKGPTVAPIHEGTKIHHLFE